MTEEQLKQAMIKRGYYLSVTYIEDKKWLYAFYKDYLNWRSISEIKYNAIVRAAYLALTLGV